MQVVHVHQGESLIMKREVNMAIWVASLSETWVGIEKTPSVMGVMPVFVKLAFWFGYWSAYEPGAIEADLLKNSGN